LIGVVENGIGEQALVLLQFYNTFLHRVLSNEPRHEHRAGLTDAVGAVGSLILDGWIPPGVEQKNVIGGREIEPETASAQGKQHDRWAGLVLKLVHHCGAVAGGAIQANEWQVDVT
jgi:hypothetical protein